MAEQHCSSCGHGLANRARFCEECGEPTRIGRQTGRPKSNDAGREFTSWLKWLFLTKNPEGKEGKWALTRLVIAACVVVFLAVTIPIGMCAFMRDQGTPGTPDIPGMPVTILNHQLSYDSYGYYVVITGQIKNTAASRVDFVSIGAKFKDAQGVVVGDCYGMEINLDAGEVRNFKLTCSETTAAVSYDIFLQ